MKLKLHLIIFLISFSSLNSQNWKSYDLASKSSIATAMVIGKLNDTIYASGHRINVANNSFIYSKDKGKTWSNATNIFEQNNSVIAQYEGVKDRVYASLKLKTNDYVYYYSKDNGVKWELDTVGLPHLYNIKTYHKESLRLKKLGSEYIAAFGTSLYLKKYDETEWKEVDVTPNSYGNSLSDIVELGTTWYALTSSNDEKITKSTDNGVTWEAVTISGLPEGYKITTLASNGKDKLFAASTATTTHFRDVFYSKDGGSTWLSTNASTIVADEYGRRITNIFAHKDKLIVSYSNGLFKLNDPSVYIYSDSFDPVFSVGNVSDLPNGSLSFPRVFFNIDDTIYLNYANDLRSMDTTSLNIHNLYKENFISVYPNPVSDQIIISSSKSFSWKIISILGKTIATGDYNNQNSTINVSDYSKGVYLFKTSLGISKKIIKK